MSAKKAPAKKPAPKQAAKRAAPRKTPPRAPKAQVPAVAPAPAAKPGDWPSELDDTTATNLFEAIENGQTVKQAAEGLGLKGNTVYQWKRRHAAFGARLEEAIEVGIDMMADEEVEIADGAKDRDDAAAVKVRLEARANYRRYKRPERFHINPFKAGAGNGDGAVLGIVLVPMKTTQTPDTTPAIDGVAVRVPAKGSLPSP